MTLVKNLQYLNNIKDLTFLILKIKQKTKLKK